MEKSELVVIAFDAGDGTVAWCAKHLLPQGGFGMPALAIAPDGRTVAFQSFASDLIQGDYNQTRDIFIARLGAPDTDHDGLDDDWELAYFNTLSRDGSGDFDSDGQTDRQELLAGTDPTDNDSVLRVLTITPLNGGNVTLLWSAAPGRTYTVQFKSAVDDQAWNNLVSNVRATTSSASAIDSSAPASAPRTGSRP